MIMHPAKPSPKFDSLSMSLTLNQPGSGKTVNYQGPFSLGLPFTRCKLTSPSIWRMCNRALRFRESAQNGGAIFLCLERARPDWEPASPRTLRSPGREIYRNVACCRTALRTTARWDFSRAQVVCNTSKTGRKWECRNVSTATELLIQKRQNGRQNVIFWRHVRSSKRFARRFCRNRSFLKKSDIIEFCPEFDVKRCQLWPRPVELGLSVCMCTVLTMWS
jgi:hypothetical protein